MSDSRSNIVLIGMAGAGKSAVGRLLAGAASLSFIDTDDLISAAAGGHSLQDIVDSDGHLALRRIEEQVLLDLHCTNHVIATGGSAVYSPAGMAHLRRQGVIVLLAVDLPTLRSRVADFETRGLAKRPEQSLEDLFAERAGLYRQHAEITVDCRARSLAEVCDAVLAGLRAGGFLRR